jgi:broad specificity phosphatase PhoE
MPTISKPRIIIMRHSERLDSVLRNCDWPSSAFVNGVYSPNLTLLPARLPLRSNPQSYLLDTPLTKYGKAHAYYTGEFFRSLGLFPLRVHTSPAMRCVQTADSVLDGLGQRDRTPLRIDLALHEPSRRELPIESEQFFSSAGFYVDLDYRPSLSADETRVIIGETRLQYYWRMHAFIKRVAEDILAEPVSSSTNLIVTHRSCVTLLAAMLNLDTIDEQLNYLYNIESNKRSEVNFLAMIIAEYDANLGLWTFLSDFPSLPECVD